MQSRKNQGSCSKYLIEKVLQITDILIYYLWETNRIENWIVSQHTILTQWKKILELSNISFSLLFDFEVQFLNLKHLKLAKMEDDFHTKISCNIALHFIILICPKCKQIGCCCKFFLRMKVIFLLGKLKTFFCKVKIALQNPTKIKTKYLISTEFFPVVLKLKFEHCDTMP